jgi:hypothetical protein
VSKLLLCAVLLVACDALDGHIDDPDNCCEAVFDVRGCLERHVRPGRCLEASCVGREYLVCRLPDGGVR